MKTAREKVLKYVVDKYGHDRVAHIITFGTMAAKMAIRDVARVQKLPLPEAIRLTKLVPERPGMTLAAAYDEVPELLKEKESKEPLVAQTLKYAEVLEGSIRQTGVHACGIIISKDNLCRSYPHLYGQGHRPLCDTVRRQPCGVRGTAEDGLPRAEDPVYTEGCR